MNTTTKKYKLFFERTKESQEYRRKAGANSLFAFTLIYFRVYLKNMFAPFHREIIDNLQDDEIRRILILGFRGCAKTVLAGIIYIVWNIAYNRRKFIIYGSYDLMSASNGMLRVINELQSNRLLIQDFGNLFFETFEAFDEKKLKRIDNFITTNGIKIIGKSAGQKVRGEIYKSNRPDLFIGDDLETSESTQSDVMRKKLLRWIKQEVLPGLDDINGKAVILANMLHYDCLATKLENDFKTIRIPVLDDEGRPTWKNRFVLTDKELEEKKDKGIHNLVSVETKRYDFGSLIFSQEMMLNPIEEGDRIVRRAWIKYYDKELRWHRVYISVDPAVKEEDKNDYTGITVWGVADNGDVYELDYVKRRMQFHAILEQINSLYKSYDATAVIVEDVQAQYYIIQELRRKYKLSVKRFSPKGDKRARLISVSSFFENSRVYFKKGHLEPVKEIVNFGSMEHKDLADSVTMFLIFHFLKRKPRTHNIDPDDIV